MKRRGKHVKKGGESGGERRVEKGGRRNDVPYKWRGVEKICMEIGVTSCAITSAFV